MIVPLSISEKLLFSTIKIEVWNKGKIFGSGTGFFFNFKDGDKFIPMVVTNKHVVRGADEVSFTVHTTKTEGEQILPSGNSVPIKIIYNPSWWVDHPDKDVDLCALFFQPLNMQAKEKGLNIFHIPLDESLIPIQSKLDELSALEDIIMVGYPNGIYDQKNNLPIMRKGITATHPAIDYDGKTIFVIDAACFPGSSGSPVLLLNEGSFSIKTGGLVLSNRVILLGVLYSGPIFNAEGTMSVEEIPTSLTAKINTRIMINLGFVIKSAELHVLRNAAIEKIASLKLTK